MPALRILLLSLVFSASSLFAQIPGDVTLEEVLPTGTFSGALGLVHAGDGSGRLFVVRQSGIVRIVENDQVQSGNFLDITGLTSASGERGLLGLAFHPDFDSNGLLYVNFTADGLAGVPTGDTVIAEYQLSAGDPDQVDPNSRRILLTVTQDFTNHNGGNLAFGPDGYLYIGMGDGGSANDPCNRAQTLDPDNSQTGGNCKDDVTTALLGKMLRIDVDNTTQAGGNNLCAANLDGSAEYAVPVDNPFASDPNACGEVWAYGLRNPWRWSFDRQTGDLWIGDVGQWDWEEIDFEPADDAGGRNYGWDVCEAEYASGTDNPCPLAGSTLPVLSYSRSGGECSVTGGYRYRGPVDSLTGTYIYGDYCSGQIWFANPDNGGWADSAFPVSAPDLRSFGEDEAGNLYVVRSGGLFRFEGDTSPVGLIFRDRFEQ
jgi:glucose/arabinose dehydrogenase